MPNASFYGGDDWKRTRLLALKRARYRCEFCGVSIAGLGQSRVDHRVPLKEAPHLALELGNLRALCVPCDAQRHASKGRLWPSMGKVGADGVPLSTSHHWNRTK